MARMVKPLTDVKVRSAKAKPREYNLPDGQGLHLRVKPNGSKLWLFNYINPLTQKRTNISFGQYPRLSLQEARTSRSEALNLLANGIDPKAHSKEQERNKSNTLQTTFHKVAEQWFQVKCSTVTDSYANDIWRSIELHLLPHIKNRPITELHPQDIIQALRPVSAKGNHETVRRVCQRLNEIMTFAVNTGLLSFNPMAGIKSAFHAPQKQHMPTLQPEQLPELIEQLFNASIKLTTRNLILWQLHTMVRPSEAAGTQWHEINFVDEVWVIPAERMKKRKEHIVPLTSSALKILKRMRLISGQHPYVFPSDRHPHKHIHAQTANMALKRMGYSGQLVAHGLRALASTTLNEAGFQSDVIEAALAHLDKNEVRRAYNHAQYLKQRRIMMEWWSNKIEGVPRSD